MLWCKFTRFKDDIAKKHSLHKKATIHKVTTMLANYKIALFPGPNHQLSTGADDPSML